MNHRLPRRSGLVSTIVGMAAIMGTAIGLSATVFAPTAEASSCPGNGASTGVQLVAGPSGVSCTKTKTIDGVPVTVHLAADQTGIATVTYTIPHALHTSVPVRVRWHRGFSEHGALLPGSDVSGVMPAGRTSVSITVTGCSGQLDMKWKYVTPGDSRGRVAAPYAVAPFCHGLPVTTTTAPVRPTTSVSPTTVKGRPSLGTTTTTLIPHTRPSFGTTTVPGQVGVEDTTPHTL